MLFAKQNNIMHKWLFKKYHNIVLSVKLKVKIYRKKNKELAISFCLKLNVNLCWSFLPCHSLILIQTTPTILLYGNICTQPMAGQR